MNTKSCLAQVSPDRGASFLVSDTAMVSLLRDAEVRSDLSPLRQSFGLWLESLTCSFAALLTTLC